MAISDGNVGLELPVMTLNLRVHNLMDGGNRWSKRVDSAASVIGAHAPVILATQEGLPKMLQDLEGRLPNYEYTGKGRDGDGGEHCAIFYDKNEIRLLQTGQFWLSETPDIPSKSWGSAYRRICTWAVFQARESPSCEFVVFNTHLDNVSQQAREQGSKLIWMKMRELTGHRCLPLVLMGDFNVVPENTVIRFWRGQTAIDGVSAELMDVLAAQGMETGTFHGFRGGQSTEQLDYIFTTSDIEAVNAQVDSRAFLGRFPSDHYPISANLKLPY
ncbi:endonuclease/exonuclease/phosphatase family protein [Alicyclobacillus sp. SO9]|uniref:endonuclease/exonuclease/phosphatase family protein n=1 Tax=Alicyclobacillus sp. SO9 TaxID=2665646 RepID=UPI0018E72F2F|nr:endonuclease/exonuclease/phosphatase family protein [Alicyclobacillus sp. SO9]QQE79070.1 endonuclease/exonuclease/phosphatase family protein [Alicyclobacillus sp. SO9]